MSDPFRMLPDQPSLRYLKIEAKRRLAAGEFPTLHDAQLAIAREHGRSSWTELKQHIESQTASNQTAQPASYALDQVRWVIDRFTGADHSHRAGQQKGAGGGEPTGLSGRAVLASGGEVADGEQDV